MKHILIGFSIHRPEMIPKTGELMAAHDVIFLEEPPDPEFQAMLEGTISIETSDAGLRQHLYSPGDLLTLFYILHPKHTRKEKEKLLAARAIIYSKIIQKQENTGNSNHFYHLKDEMVCIRLVKNLTIGNCLELFGKVRHAATVEARKIVENYGAGKPADTGGQRM